MWMLSSWQPRLTFSLGSLREILSFGSYAAAGHVSGHAVRNVDHLLIGKFLGAHELGFYTLAFKLITVPVQNLAGTISRSEEHV